jgi:hypothetical protein
MPAYVADAFDGVSNIGETLGGLWVVFVRLAEIGRQVVPKRLISIKDESDESPVEWGHCIIASRTLKATVKHDLS